MIDALIWTACCVGMVLAAGGSAVLCVFFAERGKTARFVERQKTERIGMENAFALEQSRTGQLGTGVSFELKGGEQDWT